MLTIKNYVRAKSLEEAYELNQKKNNRIIGGMLWLKMSDGNVDTAIDLCELGLDRIEETEDGFYIGAMVSLRDIELHEGLDEYSKNAVRKAVCDIVGVQFRNMATVGGSIFGRFGFSDVLTVFLAMDCYVELYKGGIVSLEEFAQMKRDNDILVRLIVKKTPARIVYSAMRASRTDFPIIACAVSEINGAYCAVIGARPEKATVIHDTEDILAKGISHDSAKAFAEYAAENAPTGSNNRASAEYRTHLVRVLTERSLLEMGGTDNGN